MNYRYLTLFCSLLATSVYAQDKRITFEDVVVNIESVSAAPIHLNSEVPNANPKPLARVLWLPSEYGVLPQEKKIATQFAQYGIESWFVDVYEAMFLSPSASSVDKVNPLLIERIIDEARADSTVPLWIIAPNRAAQMAVKGVQSTLKNPTQNLGLILINPNLYIETPLPGLVADYWPETQNINLPISIIQAELSPWKWRLNNLTEQLSASGSDVFTQVIRQVRDRFYFRADALAKEQVQADLLAKTIFQMMRLQLPYMQPPRSVMPLKQYAVNPPQKTKSIEMTPYKGQQNLGVNLPDLAGKSHTLSAYKGKVVLLNFWASWCPPCVHEMPSMARLKSHYANQNFEILAVNLGEDSHEIKHFLEAHPVNFPVLLDSQAEAVKAWQVFAYPSSFLVDKKGEIRFALFGATEWDAATHLKIIDALLAE